MNANSAWYCEDCGSSDICHMACVKWNDEHDRYGVIFLTGDNWCDTCWNERKRRGCPKPKYAPSEE